MNLQNTSSTVVDMNSHGSPSIIKFQDYLKVKDYVAAENELIEILYFINVHNYLPVGGQWNANIAACYDEEAIRHKTHIYNVCANLITNFFTDPNYVMTYKGFCAITMYKTFLHWLFAASDYGNLDHILVELGILNPQDPCNLNLKTEQDLLKLLACYTIDSTVELDFVALSKDFPEPASLTYLGCFYEARVVLKTSNEQRLNDLIQFHDILEYIHPGIVQVEFSINIWMLCTYINSDNKHLMKRSINRLLERYLGMHLKIPTNQRITHYLKTYQKYKHKKLRLIVASEKLTYNHAMYRCYIHMLTTLSEQFDTILFTNRDAYDPRLESDFSQVVSFEGSLDNLDHIVNLMVDCTPDIIFYPSLGMAYWTTVLCNLRIAPVQIMSAGHPATSMSKNIDYLIINDGIKDFICDASEKTIGYPDRNVIYARPAFDPVTVSVPSCEISRVDIAVNSKDLKIRSVFIEVCQALVTTSSKSLVFHFFPNCRGLAVDLMHNLLAKMLPNSIVYPSMDYESYIQKLASCDLALGTFPFSSSNSNVDTYLLGIPKVVYVGNRLESCTDLTEANRIQLPDWLITTTLEQYFMAALALIEEEQLRKGVCEQILSRNPEEAFFSVPEGQERDRIFPELFFNIFKQHKYYPKKKYNKRIHKSQSAEVRS